MLKRGVIGVIPLEQNHTAEYNKDELLTVLHEFRIDQSKIIAVVTDNVLNMVNTINSTFHTK